MFINTFILFPDHPPLGRHGVFVFRNEGNAESIGSWAHMMNSDDPQLGGTCTFPLFFHQWGQSLVRLGGRLGRLEGGALGNELRPWSSCATLMEPSAGDDKLLIAALKRRLRGAGGPEPKDQYVRLAVSLARDPSLVHLPGNHRRMGVRTNIPTQTISFPTARSIRVSHAWYVYGTMISAVVVVTWLPIAPSMPLAPLVLCRTRLLELG